MSEWRVSTRMKRLWVTSCCPTGVPLDDRLTRRIHRGTSVQAAGSFLPLPMPHDHELHQGLSQGNTSAARCTQPLTFMLSHLNRRRVPFVQLLTALSSSVVFLLGPEPGKGDIWDQKDDGHVQGEAGGRCLKPPLSSCTTLPSMILLNTDL